MGFKEPFGGGGGGAAGEKKKQQRSTSSRPKLGCWPGHAPTACELATNPWEMMPGLFGVLAENVEDCQE